MTDNELRAQLAVAQEKIHELEHELAETNRGLMALTMELEERGEQRTELLHQAVDDLKRSNDDLKQFAHVASHDLQEPLRMISGFLTLLE